MFCARCGHQIPDASEICPLCGREATIQLPAPMETAAASTATAPAAAPSFSAVDRDLQGVRGWLLFFCISLTVLGPLFALSQVTALSTEDAVGSILELARAVYGLVVGIFLWNVRPEAFRLLWIYFALVVLLGVLGIIGFATAPGEVKSEGLIQSIRSIIYALIWYAYFHNSVRVRSTFGRNL